MANTNVRNVGSVGGNLMLKHAHPEFPSDIFNLLEAVGASIGVIDSRSNITFHSPPSQWLTGVDMRKKCILFIGMPQLTADHHFMYVRKKIKL